MNTSGNSSKLLLFLLLGKDKHTENLIISHHILPYNKAWGIGEENDSKNWWEHAGPGHGSSPPHQISNHEFDGCQPVQLGRISDQAQKYNDMHPHHPPYSFLTWDVFVLFHYTLTSVIPIS